MDLFISTVGPNKVNLSIIPNEYEEKYNYEDPENKFDKIENISMLFKQLKSDPLGFKVPQVPKVPEFSRTLAVPQVDKIVLKDPVLYAILFNEDPTISLLTNNMKNNLIDKTIDKIKLNMDLLLRPFGFTKRRLKQKDILDNRELFYEYLTKLYKISVIIDHKIYGDEENAIDIDNDNIKLNSKDYKLQLFKEKAIQYNKENLILKLVKDLRSIADDLGIDNKKKKSELLEAINERILIILSSIRENGN